MRMPDSKSPTLCAVGAGDSRQEHSRKCRRYHDIHPECSSIYCVGKHQVYNQRGWCPICGLLQGWRICNPCTSWDRILSSLWDFLSLSGVQGFQRLSRLFDKSASHCRQDSKTHSEKRKAAPGYHGRATGPEQIPACSQPLRNRESTESNGGACLKAAGPGRLLRKKRPTCIDIRVPQSLSNVIARCSTGHDLRRLPIRLSIHLSTSVCLLICPTIHASIHLLIWSICVPPVYQSRTSVYFHHCIAKPAQQRRDGR